VLGPCYLRWLSYENRTGANIYVSANPLRAGSRRRTKESVATARHLYLDLDQHGEVNLAALRSSDTVPTPRAVISTSPGKYQVLWRVQGFDLARQEETLKLLAMAFGGDPAATDSNRMLRLPGYRNHKYDPAPLVTVEYLDDAVWSPEDFSLERGAVLTPRNARLEPRKRAAKQSQSENDWAWVCYQLALGKDALQLTEELASHRSDKPNPLYYAQRTVDLASARLWITSGITIDEVIHRLACRRSGQVPASLSAARAREIAATARRRMARE